MHHFKKECVTQSTEAGVWPQTRFGRDTPGKMWEERKKRERQKKDIGMAGWISLRFKVPNLQTFLAAFLVVLM